MRVIRRRPRAVMDFVAIVRSALDRGPVYFGVRWIRGDQVVGRSRPAALFDFLGTINRIPEEEH